LCLIISVVDAKTYTIPDGLLVVLGVGLVAWDIVNSNRYMMLSSAISALALFCIFFAVFHFMGGLGFGDVKFAGLIGYALGFQKAALACLFASLAGILFFGVLFLITRERRRAKIPFAPFLSSGFCAVLGAQVLGVV
jgi:prepilin signal peptidase PulO-like enzyme (type II secretory pathway)